MIECQRCGSRVVKRLVCVRCARHLGTSCGCFTRLDLMPLDKPVVCRSFVRDGQQPQDCEKEQARLKRNEADLLPTFVAYMRRLNRGRSWP